METVTGEVRYPVAPWDSTSVKPALRIESICTSGGTVPVTQSASVPSSCAE